MPVESLDTCQQLAVRANGDEHLRVRPHGRLEDGKGTGRELILFELRNLVLASQVLDIYILEYSRLVGSGGRGRVLSATYVSSERDLVRSSL